MTIEKGFEERFGSPPAAISEVPGRVNLIGEHVDYNGGTVLPMAVQQGITIGLRPNGSTEHCIASSSFDEAVTRNTIEAKTEHWSDYLVGALQEADALGMGPGGADVFVNATLPAGSGLSSSAALITAVLRAAAILSGTTIDAITLAQAARRVENTYIGVPCGIMDQMAVGLCLPGTALKLNTQTLAHDIIPLPTDWAISIVHSGVTRKLSDGRYEARFKECAEIKQRLGTDDLCHLDLEAAETPDLPQNLRARLRHIISDHLRTEQAALHMHDGNLNAFGTLMTASHGSYAKDFEASHPDIDAIVATACASGANGARLTGGGFGGCVVIATSVAAKSEVLNAILAAHPNAWIIQ